MFRSLTDSQSSGWSLFQVAPLSNRFFPVSLKRLSLRQEALVTLAVQPADCHDDQLVTCKLSSKRVLILYSLLIVSYTLAVTLAMANLNHSSARGEEILYILYLKSVR